MRLACILLVASTVLVGVLDVSATATGNTVVANPAMVNSAFAPESQGRRSLRLVKDDAVDDDDDDESADEVDEERMWAISSLAKAKKALEDKMALTAVASNFLGKSVDDMGEVIMKLTPVQIDTLFDKGEDAIKAVLPGFSSGMSFEKFDKLIIKLPPEQQAVMTSAYTKYLVNKGLL